ncbi:General amino acid permease AGP2 [Metarhizium anisopliae]
MALPVDSSHASPPSKDPEKTLDSTTASSVQIEYAQQLRSSHAYREDNTHRRLKGRHVQLMGIGGTIGTVLFVQIGQGLLKGGPGSLFIAFTFWCSFVLAVTMCIAEMVSYTPISSPFIRFAGRYVDDALGFATGWNFFILEAMLVPFEVTACNIIMRFWTDAIPTVVMIIVIIVLYVAINLLAVHYFGEVEFWAALGKVLLAVGLILFTFIVMVGGNPKRDVFGFRYWNTPGAFAELYYKGALGKWFGFLHCLVLASFTIAGPDYVAMTAGETASPRQVLPRAFKAVFYRLTFFFVLGSLCVGILVPYDDAGMAAAFKTGQPGAAAAPSVAAMKRLDVPVLPHIVNGVVLLSAFSAGNSYLFCASRSLYGLALDHKAPAFLTRCTSKGVPIYCVASVLVISLLSFLQLSQSSVVVLNWLVSLVTASQLINFACACITYLCFYRALKAQAFDRNRLPYRGLFMPYTAWYGLIGTAVMALVGGYAVFLPLEGHWNVPDFLFSYTMVAVVPLLYVFWKLFHKTKIHKPLEVDLNKDQDSIEDYERNYEEQPPS